MKTPFTLALLTLLVAHSASGQSSVWELRSGENVVYLGGTFHLLRAEDFPLPEEFDAAFAEAATICFETDLARMQERETQQLLLARGIYGEIGSLKSAVSDDAWRALEGYCERTNTPIARLNQFKPWMVTISITVIEMQKLGFALDGVDMHYHRRATEAGKTVQGLETFEEQLEFITTMGAGHESAMLINTINEVDEIPHIFEGAVAAWRTGDLRTLDILFLRELRSEFPSVHQELFVERNEAWLPRIEEMLESPPTELVLVGAAHLAGSQGLIARLRQRGHHVEPFIVGEQ